MKCTPKKPQRIEHWHVVAALMILYDVVAVNLAGFLALWIRFDCQFSLIEPIYIKAWLQYMPIHTIVCLVALWITKMYNSIWRFASYNELLRTILATAITGVVNTIGITILINVISEYERMPIPYYVFCTGFQFLLLIGVRFSYRLVLLERSKAYRSRLGSKKRVMLIGAGNAGQMILRDTQISRETNVEICCIIDDNANKWGRHVGGVPVVGGRDSILANVAKYKVDAIFVAVPSASEEDKLEILNICKETGCELKNLPGMYQLMNEGIRLSHLKDVAVEDLLGREPIRVDMEQIYTQINGKTILVTGGGGSIGSELCRQIAGQNPKQLVIFDVYENNAYDIEQELKDKYPELNLKVLIGSVRDSRCLERVFSLYKPDIVYHAAAHKHVPLMETSPCEAIKNNVIGTYKTAYAALLHGCQRFVLISTDKAVNPTNIMGASKRLCEMVIQSFDRAVKEGKQNQIPQLYTHREKGETPSFPDIQEGKTEFVAVRFGNVLGSNGSVIPLVKRQIQKGGPVTVTHPDIIRYFMTIPEAVSLVMQAGCFAKGGEIFVLDMGAPVKIDELARNLIKLSGLTPDVDIKIVYSGLRPGEKLYEEKLMAEEGMKKTANKLIHIGNPIPFDTDVFLTQLRGLMEAAYENDASICSAVEAIVPTYRRKNAGKQDAVYEELYKEAVPGR